MSKVEGVIAIILVSLVAMSIRCPLYTQNYTEKVIINIDSYGIANVSITLALNAGLHEIPLPIDPIVATILVLGDTQAIPIVYVNDSLYLILDKALNITISYIANISIMNNIFYLNIKTEDIVKLKIPIDIILLSWPEENIIEARLERDVLLLLIRGPTIIRYTLRLPHILISTPMPTPSTTPTQTTIPTPTPETIPIRTPTITPSRQEYPWLIPVIISISIAIPVSILTYLVLHRRRETHSSIMPMLSDVDIEILKALEAKGGSALQIELQNDIKIPKTTLWRHIKKLEKLGIVKVEKVGLQNKIVLIKRIKIS